MSYSKCKGITIKKNREISVNVASSNIYPLYYYQSEIIGENFEQKLFYLFENLMSREIQINTINNSTMKYEYALLKVKEYLKENNIDSYEDLYCKQWVYYQEKVNEILGFDVEKALSENNKELVEKYNNFKKDNKSLIKQLEYKSEYKIYEKYFNMFKDFLNENYTDDYVMIINGFFLKKMNIKTFNSVCNKRNALQKNFKYMYIKSKKFDNDMYNIKILKYDEIV